MVGVLKPRLGPAFDRDSSFNDWSKLDTRGDIVDVRLEMLWHVVPIELISKLVDKR